MAVCHKCQKTKGSPSWRQLGLTALCPDNNLTTAVWLTAVCRRQNDALPWRSMFFLLFSFQAPSTCDLSRRINRRWRRRWRPSRRSAPPGHQCVPQRNASGPVRVRLGAGGEKWWWSQARSGPEIEPEWDHTRRFRKRLHFMVFAVIICFRASRKSFLWHLFGIFFGIFIFFGRS